MSYVSYNLSLFQSYIGQFSIAILDYTIDGFFNYGLIPAMNVLLDLGIPLPVPPEVEFIDPIIGESFLILF